MIAATESEKKQFNRAPLSGNLVPSIENPVLTPVLKVKFLELKTNKMTKDRKKYQTKPEKGHGNYDEKKYFNQRKSIFSKHGER